MLSIEEITSAECSDPEIASSSVWIVGIPSLRAMGFGWERDSLALRSE